MKEQILKLRAQGKSLDEISQLLGCAKTTVSYHCNPEVRENFKARRRVNRKKILTELKLQHGGRCTICGYDKCLDALHFHHPEGTEKEGSVGKMIGTNGKAAAYAEAAKCKLICANCHAEIHAD